MIKTLKTVFTFPGQGSQFPTMLQDELSNLQRASEILGEPIKDDEKSLESTKWIQLCLFVKEVAVARRLLEKGVIPEFVVGHSIGAFSAAVISGVLSFEQGLLLVKNRSELMENAYPRDFGMGVILGLNENEVKKAVHEEFSETNPVYMSNINAELQIAVSGSWQGIENVFKKVGKIAGVKTTRLKVPTPSHSPLMSDVSERLVEILKTFSLGKPEIPYFSNHTGRLLRSDEEIEKDLALNVMYPVRFADMIRGCTERDADCFIEMPPGNVLTKLVKQSYPEAHHISVGDVGEEAVKYLINKWEVEEK